MKRSRLLPVRATAPSGARAGKKPPSANQLSLTPDQSTPLNHQEVYTRPSLPVMKRSRLSAVGATASMGAPAGKNPPIERQLSLTPDQSTPLNHQEVYTRPSLPVMKRSRLSAVGATASMGAPAGKNPPIERQLSLTPDQSTPLNHHEVYTRPSFPVMKRSRLSALRATAAMGAPAGKNPPIERQLSLTPDQSTPLNHQEVYTRPSFP